MMLCHKPASKATLSASVSFLRTSSTFKSAIFTSKTVSVTKGKVQETNISQFLRTCNLVHERDMPSFKSLWRKRQVKYQPRNSLADISA